MAKQHFKEKTKEKSEFDQKTLDVARVTRVVAGGRRFRFRILVGIGNRKGKVGIGMAKSQDMSQGIEKAAHQAKKRLISVLIKDGTIPHEVDVKFRATKLIMNPAPVGRGIVAGGAVRILCELAGIENISAKILSRSKNKINIAKATLKALKKLKIKN
jgi:small subunit ribosomal protein S5